VEAERLAKEDAEDSYRTYVDLDREINVGPNHPSNCRGSDSQFHMEEIKDEVTQRTENLHIGSAIHETCDLLGEKKGGKKGRRTLAEVSGSPRRRGYTW
jgi:hypothetical protein